MWYFGFICVNAGEMKNIPFIRFNEWLLEQNNNNDNNTTIPVHFSMETPKIGNSLYLLLHSNLLWCHTSSISAWHLFSICTTVIVPFLTISPIAITCPIYCFDFVAAIRIGYWAGGNRNLAFYSNKTRKHINNKNNNTVFFFESCVVVWSLSHYSHYTDMLKLISMEFVECDIVPYDICVLHKSV